MTRYAMVIDVTRCDGCYNCFIVCKDEYCNQEKKGYSAAQPMTGQDWMKIIPVERGQFPKVKQDYIATPCMQCEAATCMNGEGDAVYKRDDGIVIIDPKKAVGQKQIVKACPYGVIFWNEEKKLPQKCTLCAHRIDEGKVPRCVQACPSGCLVFGDFDDPESEVSQLLASGKTEVFHPEWKTKPNIYYVHLEKATRNFIGGAIAYKDTDECAEGAQVVLKGPKGRTLRTKANAFGNFDFDGLLPGAYSVSIEAAGYKPQVIDIDLKTDKYLGVINLVKV